MIHIESGTVLAVVGPTATGKSELALKIAAAHGGQIINADSMQLYRGMDIGTAKVPPVQRHGIPHHLFDVLDIREEASVATYQVQVRAIIDELLASEVLPILVGGSGLYLRAALENFEFPPTDPDARAALEQRAQTEGPGILHDELARKDPLAAQRIERANTRRIVRALEVITLTGQPFSASLPDPTYIYPTRSIGIAVEVNDLDARINARSAAMFDEGLLEETRALLDNGLLEGKTASKAVGYAQAIDVIAGRASVAEAVAATALATRQLSRRQRTWFRRDSRIEWLTQ